MYRLLAPQITENPIFMQATDVTPEGLKAAVDQCVETGFEMIMMSFGGGMNMESKNQTYIQSVADGVAYAHSKGIEVGGCEYFSLPLRQYLCLPRGYVSASDLADLPQTT